jgi:hypothetical protein
VIGIFWARDVELQMLVVRIGVLDSAFEEDVLRNIEVGRSGNKLYDRQTQERTEEGF